MQSEIIEYETVIALEKEEYERFLAMEGEKKQEERAQCCFVLKKKLPYANLEIQQMLDVAMKVLSSDIEVNEDIELLTLVIGMKVQEWKYGLMIYRSKIHELSDGVMKYKFLSLSSYFIAPIIKENNKIILHDLIQLLDQFKISYYQIQASEINILQQGQKCTQRKNIINTMYNSFIQHVKNSITRQTWQLLDSVLDLYIIEHAPATILKGFQFLLEQVSIDILLKMPMSLLYLYMLNENYNLVWSLKVKALLCYRCVMYYFPQLISPSQIKKIPIAHAQRLLVPILSYISQIPSLTATILHISGQTINLQPIYLRITIYMGYLDTTSELYTLINGSLTLPNMNLLTKLSIWDYCLTQIKDDRNFRMFALIQYKRLLVHCHKNYKQMTYESKVILLKSVKTMQYQLQIDHSNYNYFGYVINFLDSMFLLYKKTSHMEQHSHKFTSLITKCSQLNKTLNSKLQHEKQEKTITQIELCLFQLSQLHL